MLIELSPLESEYKDIKDLDLVQAKLCNTIAVAFQLVRTTRKMITACFDDIKDGACLPSDRKTQLKLLDNLSHEAVAHRFITQIKGTNYRYFICNQKTPDMAAAISMLSEAGEIKMKNYARNPMTMALRTTAYC